MKTILVTAALASVTALVGCGGASRTPAQYSEDTGKAFAEQEPDLKSCYDSVLASKADAKGDVTVHFYWNAANEEKDTRIARKAIEVSMGPQTGEADVVAAKTTAPPELVKCATDAVAKARLKPAGKGIGEATWTFHFAAGEAPSAAPAAAPAADADKS